MKGPLVSVIASTEQRRTWLVPLLIAGGLLLVGGVVAAILIVHDHSSGEGGKLGVQVTKPSIPQAAWKVQTFPAGAIGAVTKSQAAAVKAQHGAVTSLVEDTFNALVLHQDKGNPVTSHFSKAAAGALLRSKIGAPKGAQDLQTTRRFAHIGIQVHGATQAAAKVIVEFKAKVNGKLVKLRQLSTLWMQRAHGHWTVIGFDANQEPHK